MLGTVITVSLEALAYAPLAEEKTGINLGSQPLFPYFIW